MEFGGDGSPGRRFMPEDIRGAPFEEPEIGGVTRVPRLVAKVGECGRCSSLRGPRFRGYPDPSLPSFEPGEKGPDRPFVMDEVNDIWSSRVDCAANTLLRDERWVFSDQRAENAWIGLRIKGTP